MHKLRQIFAFVAPYVKPYWGRIVAGVFFGILFGVSNGLALWTTKIMLDRLVPANDSLAAASATPCRIATGLPRTPPPSNPIFSRP